MNTDQQSDNNNQEQSPENPSRRQAIKQFVLGGIGAAGSISVVRSYEEKCLAEESKPVPAPANAVQTKVDGVSAATRTSFKNARTR